MANQSGKGNRSDGPRKTRVYAPTHRSGATSNEQRKPAKQADKRPAPMMAKETAQKIKRPPVSAQRNRGQASFEKPVSRHTARGQVSPPQNTGRSEQPRRQTGRHTGAADKVLTLDLRKNRQGQHAKAKSARQKNGSNNSRNRAKANKPVQRDTRYGGIHRLMEPLRWEEQKKERQRKQRNPINPKTLLSISIGVVSMALVLAALYFVFIVDTILVEGNARYSESSIIEISELATGRHMLLNNLDKAKARIVANPYLKVVSIERELPRTIHIVIEEREEVAAIAVQDYVVIIDMEGHVLSIGAGSDISSLLRITGISQLGFQVNQKLDTGSDMQIRALMLILEQMEAYSLRADIVSIDLTNPLRLTMQTTDGITVLLGQPENMEQKMYWLRQTLPSLRGGGITQGTLDVSPKGGAIYSPPNTVTPVPEEGENDPETIPENDPENDPENLPENDPQSDPANQPEA